MLSISSFERSLFVGAHLDDIELAAGGLASRVCDQNLCARWLVLTDSAYESFNGKSSRNRDEALDEGRQAAKTIGIDRLDVCGFSAKDVDNDSRTVEVIEAAIEEFDPSIILTHWPFDTHRAHANTALATIAAARRRNAVLMYEPAYPSGRSYVGFRPQAYVAIGPEEISRKAEALRMHHSEYLKYGGEEWIEGIVARARYRGFEIGKQYAEAFEVLRLGIEL